jgi:hypothetical protein
MVEIQEELVMTHINRRNRLIQSATLPLLILYLAVLISISVRNTFSCNTTSLASNKATVEPSSAYKWRKATEKAAFPVGYNYPVYVAQNRMWAFHPEGIWHSTDGTSWAKADLPSVQKDIYTTKYVQFNEAVYALGQNQGNYLKMTFGSTIRRTTDFQKWETLAEKSNLPNRIFHALLVFNNKIWLLGGFDGKAYYNDVWNSSDGVHWTPITKGAAWSPRTIAAAVVYKNRLWIIGGSVIDGDPVTNKNAAHEVWSSADGASWTLVSDRMPGFAGNSPIVFDNKLWLVGANRDGTFGKSSLTTEDGVTWKEEAAPWSPRGGVATWIYDGKLFMTGGKYSVTENGVIRFIYSNEVWCMTPEKMKG